MVSPPRAARRFVGRTARKGAGVSKIRAASRRSVEKPQRRFTMATAILPQERPTMTTQSEPVEIYCVKCKVRTASRDIEAVTMKNGRAATRSVCVECGTKKFRIGVLP